MESFRLVMEIVALACVSALSVYLVTVLGRVRSILSEVDRNLKELSTHAIPVLENLEVITEKVKNVTENIDGQMEMLRGSISSIREIADNVANFERRIQERVEEPVLETVSVFVAAFKGVRAFVERLRA